jgi:hypothetical protein
MDHTRCVDDPQVYEIKVQEGLQAAWSDWFGGMDLTIESEGMPLTRLIGVVADQCALRTILNRIWDLNLTLLAVNRIETEGQHGKELERWTR